jgi:hypothetical protein
MPKSSYEVTAFLGGEFSQQAQGRSDIPNYRQAMSLSLNGHPIEEGAWVKRSGFTMLVPSRGRTFCRLIGFDGSATCSFAMAFTNDNLQFVTERGLIFDNTIATITGINTSTGEVTFTPAQSGWAVGNQIMVVFPDVTSPLSPYPQDLTLGISGQLLTIGAKEDSTHLIMYDDQGDGSPPLFASIPSGALVGAQILRVLNLTTVYSGVETLQDLRAVQFEYQSIILSSGITPYVVQITTEPTPGPGGADPVFSIAELGMVDGPYLDPSGDTGTASALTGTITFTASSTTPFLSTDVGRHIRLFSEPPLWNAGTAYSAGDNVTDSSGAWWTALISNTGVIPGQATVVAGVQQLAWAPNVTAGTWAWGIISVVNSSSEVTVPLDTTIPGMVLGYTAITSFQLGVFSNSTTYPTCGANHQGRLWLAGAVDNRFDTTISNGVNLGIATWSPTDPNGNVLDDSGISLILNSRYTNKIQWLKPDQAGVIMGTLSGEFLVSASVANDPITPTNIEGAMITKEGSFFHEPIQAGMSTIFIQKYGRHVKEYLADAFSQKFSARNLNDYAEHLTVSGVQELAYQEEPFPCIWARMGNGLLAGCTYRRYTRFVSEPANIQGWHRHLHGRQRPITSMCVIPGAGGLLERLFIATNDPQSFLPGIPAPQNYFIEILQPPLDESQTALNGYFCDEATGPGPGADPAYDCGGGNASIFGPFGANGGVGADTFTPDMDNVLPFTAGAPAAGQPLNLQVLEASYLDGSTMLYGQALYGAPTSLTGMSLSVWVASADYPLGAGSLFSSPALTSVEANAHTAADHVSQMLGAGTMLASASDGVNGEGYSSAQQPDTDNVLAGGQEWNHVMIALKSNGDGTCTCTVAMNDTVIVNAASIGAMSDHSDIWPFASQPGGNKDGLGLTAWCIGGAYVVDMTYDTNTTISSGPAAPLAVPTVAQLINEILADNANKGDFQAVLPAVATLEQYAAGLAAAQNVQRKAVITTTYTGGQGNVPYDNAYGSYLGYKGSLAELFVFPTFIDWTSSTNRNKLQHFNSTSDLWAPLSAGSNGAGTSLGTPYIYLSGPPSVFNLNRASGKRMTVLGDDILASPLPPPGP